MIKNLPQIVLLNIVGLALFLSWYIPVNHGFWLPIDADIFYFFNQKLVESKAFLWLVALTNNRAFDGCSLLAMGMLKLVPPETLKFELVELKFDSEMATVTALPAVARLPSSWLALGSFSGV